MTINIEHNNNNVFNVNIIHNQNIYLNLFIVKKLLNVYTCEFLHKNKKYCIAKNNNFLNLHSDIKKFVSHDKFFQYIHKNIVCK